MVGSQKKPDRHGDATSLPVPTSGPVDRLWIGFRARYFTASIYLLRGDRPSILQGKRSKNAGAL